MWINAKLLEIQKEQVRVDKDGKNPHYKSNYVTLDNLLSVILPIASDKWLVITHYIHDRKLITNVGDTESGEVIISSFPLTQDDPQKLWSAITYAKRYNIGAVFNVITELDDDGNYAKENPIDKIIGKMYKVQSMEELKKLFLDWMKLNPDTVELKRLETVKDQMKSQFV
jgi:hypothetical protein